MKKRILLTTVLLIWGCAGGQKDNLVVSRDEAQKNLAKYEAKADKNPEDVKALFELARANASLGKYDDALRETDEIIKTNSSFAQAYFLRAQILQELGRPRDRFKTFWALLKITNEQEYVGTIAREIGSPFAIDPVALGPGNNYLAKYSQDGQRIIWQSDRDGDWNIYTAAADGSQLQAVIVDQGDDEFPAFSPGGTEIVFTSTRDEFEPKVIGEQNRELYLYVLNTRRTERLTRNNVDDWAPIFYPDSASILYVSESGDPRQVKFFEKNSNLFVYRFADSTASAATADGWDNTSPAPFQNGKLLWVQIKEGSYAIVVGTPGKEEKVLLTSKEPKSGLTAAADGSAIAFFMKRDGNIDIFRLEIDSKKLTRLTADFATDFYPVFAPNGNKILFSSNRGGSYGLYTINLQQPISRDQLMVQLQTMIAGSEMSASSE